VYPFERFSEGAKRALALAQDEAETAHHSYIGTEHMLLGLLREGDGLAAKVLANLGVEIDKVRGKIQSVLGRTQRVIVQQTMPTSRVKKVIEIAFEEAKRMSDTSVGTEHLLLGLLVGGEGIAARVLEDLGVTLERVRTQIGEMRHEGRREGEGSGLSSFATGHQGRARLGARVPGAVAASLLRAESEPHLTAEARSAIALAEEECLHLGAAALGTEHLLLGILRQGLGRGASALAQAGVVLDHTRSQVGLARGGGERPLELSWAPAARSALAEAVAAARGLPVDTGVLLAALAGDESGAGAVLRRLGAEPDAVRAWLAQAGSDEIPPPA
jgi:ATP-dependent Clp protease ATP-binding subunit ClpA